MPYIQENKTRAYWNGEKRGKKYHSRFSITIPREIIKFMGWNKGDELKFLLKEGEVVLRKGENQNQAVFLKKVKPLSTSAYVSVPRKFIGKEAVIIVKDEKVY